MEDADTRFEKLTSRLGAAPGQATRLRALRDSDVLLDVHLLPGSHLPEGSSPSTGNAWLAEALSSMPASLRARLGEVEARVLKWINASPNNARAFSADPIAALKKAAPGLDSTTLETLKQLRSEHSPVPDDLGIHVRELKLQAKARKS